MSNSTAKLLRYTLAGLLFLIAVNAFGGGYYALAGAQNVPKEWLEGSPFHSYFVPGLFLLVVVGGSCLFGAIAVLMRLRISRTVAIAAAGIILGWIAVQLMIIGSVSWLQPAVAAIGIVILIMSLAGKTYLSRPNNKAVL